MDKELLEKVVEELAALLPGARVDKITQPIRGGICLHLHQQRLRPFLLLSPDRPHPRIHLLSKRPDAARVPSQLLLFLRKQLVGARIDRLQILNNDRVVDVHLTGQRGPLRLVFELTGVSANILLLDQDGRILTVLFPRSPDGSGQRLLLPGATYEPPATGQGSRSPVKSRPVEPEGSGEAGTRANRAAEAYGEQEVAERETAALRQALRAALARSLGKVQRRIEAITGDLQRAQRAEEYQEAGAAILAHLGQLRKGLERAELPDEAGKLISITLDPARTPTENAGEYFRRSKKARSSRARIRERLDDARKEAETLRRAAEEVHVAAGLQALEHAREKMLSAGLLHRQRAKPKAKAPSPTPAVRTVQYAGWNILIGKSAAGNDHITRTVARPDDVWLHAEGMPGSHVLVRNPERLVVPGDVLLQAAAFAAYFSKGRGAAKVPVTFTQAKFVKKPKGAKPGLAVLTERRTIMVEPKAP